MAVRRSRGGEERRGAGKKNWRCFRAGFGVSERVELSWDLKRERGRTIFCTDSEGCSSGVQFILPYALLEPTLLYLATLKEVTYLLLQDTMIFIYASGFRVF